MECHGLFKSTLALPAEQFNYARLLKQKKKKQHALAAAPGNIYYSI